MNFKQLLAEKFHKMDKIYSFVHREQKIAEVFKDPSKGEIDEVSTKNGSKAFRIGIDSNAKMDVYIWEETFMHGEISYTRLAPITWGFSYNNQTPQVLYASPEYFSLEYKPETVTKLKNKILEYFPKVEFILSRGRKFYLKDM